MADRTAHQPVVRVQSGEVSLEGFLQIPADATAIILFAHGSGSSRHSIRNQQVAATLREGGLATLLIDLLTVEEEEEDLITRRLRFDIALLARRVAGVVDWLNRNQKTQHLAVGLIGSSTGAAAALIAAAQRPEQVKAVVSRGGRPDLAAAYLSRVQAPTLLVVGGEDREVLALNQQALNALTCPKRLEIIPGATHLFEEPGTLEQAAKAARTWFVHHLLAQETQ
jgi:putative phosphoribosyl transferase